MVDYTAALGNRSITYFRLDKDPSVPFRLTSRKNKAKDGSMSYEVEVFSMNNRIGARFFLSAEKETIPCIVMWMLATGRLSGLEAAKDDDKCMLLFGDISKGVYDDIVDEDGVINECEYSRQRRIRGEEINVKELEARRAFLKRFNKLYGQVPVSEFSRHDFQIGLVDTLRFKFRGTHLPKHSKKARKELSTKTVLNYISILSVVFENAVKRHICSENPCKDIAGLLKKPGKETSFHAIDRDTLIKLYTEPAAWDDIYVYGMILLLTVTGMRISEAMALQHDDVDFDSRVIHIRHSLRKERPAGSGLGAKKVYVLADTKTDTTRTVPMGDLAWMVLNLFAHKRGYVFSFDGSEPIEASNYRRKLRKALKTIGIDEETQVREKFVVHSTRHSFTSLMISKNISDNLISLVTGHDTQRISAMNMRYAQLLEDALPLLRDAINGFFPEEEIRNMAQTFAVLVDKTGLLD